MSGASTRTSSGMTLFNSCGRRRFQNWHLIGRPLWYRINANRTLPVPDIGNLAGEGESSWQRTASKRGRRNRLWSRSQVSGTLRTRQPSWLCHHTCSQLTEGSRNYFMVLLMIRGCYNESESWHIRDGQFNLNYPMILTVPKIKPAFSGGCLDDAALVLAGNQFWWCRSHFPTLSSRSLFFSSRGNVRVDRR